MDLGQFFLIVLGGSVVFFVISSLFGMEHGDIGGHDHGGDGESGFMSDLFTLRNIFLFGVGYGAAGYVARYLGAGPLVSHLIGALLGVVLALLGMWLFRTLRSQQSNTIANLETLVGKTARVVTAIPENGRGEVTTTNSFGAQVTLPAQSTDGARAENETVEILAVVGNTATVKKV